MEAHPANPIPTDLKQLRKLLRETVGGKLPAGAKDLRILNLACGACDEAETLIDVGRDLTGGSVEMVGADIRIREVLEARKRFSNLPAEFLLEDATQIGQHKELGNDFNMLFLRHQNYWHGRELWKKIFDQGLTKLDDNGLMVITSYFDKEHRLALEALQKLGMEVVENRRNTESRALPTEGKSVDRWVAVLRKKTSV
jgi:hypothetical protein